MSEQSPDGIPTEDTPTADTPEGTGTEASVEQTNWEERYKEAQAWGTRVAQEKSQLEAQATAIADLKSDDPDTRARAAQALGLPFEFVEDDANDDDDQTPFLTREEWQAYQAQQAQREQQTQAQAAQEAAIAQIDTAIQSHEALNALDKDDRDWVIAKALSIDPKMTPEGVPLPDIDSALEQFTGWSTGRMEKWRQSKRAPAIKAGGQVGTQAVPDDATHSQRVAAMLEALEANS